MNLRFYKRMKLEGGVRVMVSQRYCYDFFGVRSKDAAFNGSDVCQNGKFICTGGPGTGFFMRDSDSDTYVKFATGCGVWMRPSLWDFVFGNEFSYDKEVEAVKVALEGAKDEAHRRVLESYGKCLQLAKVANGYHRVVRGVKRKMGSHPTKRYTSVISHMRNRIHELRHELHHCRLNVEEVVNEETMVAYHDLCRVFRTVANTRRIWSLHRVGKEMDSERVFFDMGMFDYINAKNDTPIMRDADGVCYYIYPTHIIRARSSCDFDMIEMKNLHVEFKETLGETLPIMASSVDSMSGRALGEVHFVELGKSFYFRHRTVAHQLVDALHAYQTKVFGV